MAAYTVCCWSACSASEAGQGVVAFLAVLNYALKRTVRHIRIACLKQQQCCQNPNPSAIAILKWMNRQKHDSEHRDDQQWMLFLVCSYPSSSHSSNSDIRRGVSKGVAVSNTMPIILPIGIKCSNVIAESVLYSPR